VKTAMRLVLLAAASFSAWGQDQRACEAILDAQLKEMYTLNQSYAGSVRYKEMFQNFMACAQSGKCGKPDTLVGLMEMMVDDEVIAIQRRKVGVVKAFFARMRETGSDSCRAAKEFPEVLDQLKNLNNAQLDRFAAMTNEFVKRADKAK